MIENRNTSASNSMALAEYWNMTNETLDYAMKLVRSNPCISMKDAIRAGFKHSAETLMPMPIIEQR